MVQNPFAKKVILSSQVDKDKGVALEYTSRTSSVTINRSPVLKKLSVTIQNLTIKVLKKFNHSSNTASSTASQSQDMSGKNISKDCSTSPGRNEKKDRFNKGRTGEGGTNKGGTKQEHPEPGLGGGAHGENGNGNGQEIPSGKRPREPPRISMHDDIMGEDTEDEEMPGAKRAMTSIREKLTHVYTKRTKETHKKRDEGRVKPLVEFRIDTSNAGEKVKTRMVPLLAHTKLANAPTLSLKDLVPKADRREIEEYGRDESFRTDLTNDHVEHLSFWEFPLQVLRACSNITFPWRNFPLNHYKFNYV